jgi:hypothetical protein
MRWFVVVAFLGGAAIGIVIGYALGRLHHRPEGPPKPVQVRIERAPAAEAAGVDNIVLQTRG